MGSSHCFRFGTRGKCVLSCAVVDPLTERTIGDTGVSCLVFLYSAMVDAQQVPWAAVCVWGVPDSPISFSASGEHSLMFSGDHHYIVLVGPAEQYLVLQMIGDEDLTH